MSDRFNGRWLAQTRYHATGCVEICVVREDNNHGRISLGWESADKMILFAGQVRAAWFNPLISPLSLAAERFAEKLNRKETRQ